MCIRDRSKAEQTHRYFTIEHNMNLVFSENTGEYLNKKQEKVLDASSSQELNVSLNEEETIFVDSKE